MGDAKGTRLLVLTDYVTAYSGSSYIIFDRLYGMLQIMCCFSPAPYLSLPKYKFIFISSVKIFFLLKKNA